MQAGESVCKSQPRHTSPSQGINHHEHDAVKLRRGASRVGPIVFILSKAWQQWLVREETSGKY